MIAASRGVWRCAAGTLVVWLACWLVFGGGLREPLALGQQPAKAKKKGQKKAPSKKPAAAKPAANESSSKASESKPGYETIKLAHGQEVHVEKWGDTFEAYEYRPSVDLNDKSVEEVIWFNKIPGGPSGLTLDSKSGHLYWPHGDRGPTGSKIARSTLDGKQITFLVQGLTAPRDLVLDLAHRKMFWIDGDEAHRELKTADFNGKGVKSIAEGLNYPQGLAVDSEREELYYWEEPGRIVRVKTDGTGQSEFVSKELDPAIHHTPNGLFWSDEDRKLYWMNFGGKVRRMAADAAAPEELFDASLRQPFHSFFVDVAQNQIIYPVDGAQLIRSSLDGSEHEILATTTLWKDLYTLPRKGVSRSVAVDKQRGMIYFLGGHYDGSSPLSSFFRIKLPPPLKRTVRPAPPLITSLMPEAVKAGESLTIAGKYLSDAKAVTFVDDSTCEHRSTKFRSEDDYVLKVTVPKLSDQCSHPLIIVETPSGVTMTLRRDLKVLNNSHRQYTDDRFQHDTMLQLWLEGGAMAGKIEHAVVYIDTGSRFGSEANGRNTAFIKNRTQADVRLAHNCIFYHEPFVRMGIQDADTTLKLHPVPAIRPSFLDKLLTYEQ
jgi:hypothetical protein